MQGKSMSRAVSCLAEYPERLIVYPTLPSAIWTRQKENPQTSPFLHMKSTAMAEGMNREHES
jgi:hypothetical protein